MHTYIFTLFMYYYIGCDNKLTKEDTRMVKKKMIRCPTSLIVREMQIIKVRYIMSPIKLKNRLV